MLWPYLYDVVLVLIFVLFIRRGWRTGFFASLLRLLGWVVALFLVVRYSLSFAEWMYDNLLEEKIIAAVAAAIPQDLIASVNSSAVAAQDALNSIQSVLNSLGGILGDQSVNSAGTQTILNLLEQDGMTLASAITETILEPVVIPVVQALVSVVAFLLCIWIFRLLSSFSARHHNRRGVVGGANSLLGGVIGLAESFAVAYLYAFILSVAADGFGDKLSFLTPAIYDKTLLVSLFVK